MLRKIYSSGLTWLWISLLVIAVDRFTKLLVIDRLMYMQPFKVLPIFNITLAFNTGAAFSFLHSMSGWQNLFLGGLAVIISLVIIYWLATTPANERWMNIALCLILGGAIGNAWDRAGYHFVIDFLDFHLGTWHFAIFNVADSAICVGAFMLFIGWIRQR